MMYIKRKHSYQRLEQRLDTTHKPVKLVRQLNAIPLTLDSTARHSNPYVTCGWSTQLKLERCSCMHERWNQRTTEPNFTEHWKEKLGTMKYFCFLCPQIWSGPLLISKGWSVRIHYPTFSEACGWGRCQVSAFVTSQIVAPESQVMKAFRW